MNTSFIMRNNCHACDWLHDYEYTTRTKEKKEKGQTERNGTESMLRKAWWSKAEDSLNGQV